MRKKRQKRNVANAVAPISRKNWLSVRNVYAVVNITAPTLP